MIQEQSARELAAATLELQRHPHDPQLVLTNLVRIHGILVSSSSLSVSGPPVSETVKILKNIMLQYLDTNEEIVWFLCRIISAWSTSSHRFTLEAGQCRLWETLKLARIRYSESPRVLETSLEATAALFNGVELHQLVAPHDVAHDKFLEELFQLMDRFHTPPARHSLLSPHYDFSKIVVAALKVLCKLFASPRIVTTDRYRHGNQYCRPILERLREMLPHFLKTVDASRTWLTMCRLQLQYAPPLALRILFVEGSREHSWCQQLLDQWRSDVGVVYDFAALFTQVFAVPQGSKILPSPALDSEISQAVVLQHGVIDILIELFVNFSRQLTDPSTCTSDVDRLRPTVLEIERSLRQFSCVVELRNAFPHVTIAKKAFIPACVTVMEQASVALRHGTQDPPQYYMRVLLELVLTLQQLAQTPVFAHIIKSTEILSALLHQILKCLASIQKMSRVDDAGDSDLPVVLQREVGKLVQILPSIPTASSSASRGFQRRPPASSSRTLSRFPSITRSAVQTTVLMSSSFRKTPLSSSPSLLVHRSQSTSSQRKAETTKIEGG